MVDWFNVCCVIMWGEEGEDRWWDCLVVVLVLGWLMWGLLRGLLTF